MEIRHSIILHILERVNEHIILGIPQERDSLLRDMIMSESAIMIDHDHALAVTIARHI